MRKILYLLAIILFVVACGEKDDDPQPLSNTTNNNKTITDSVFQIAVYDPDLSSFTISVLARLYASNQTPVSSPSIMDWDTIIYNSPGPNPESNPLIVNLKLNGIPKTGNYKLYITYANDATKPNVKTGTFGGNLEDFTQVWSEMGTYSSDGPYMFYHLSPAKFNADNDNP